MESSFFDTCPMTTSIVLDHPSFSSSESLGRSLVLQAATASFNLLSAASPIGYSTWTMDLYYKKGHIRYSDSDKD